MLPENETVTFEDRLYVNPETSLNEQLGFIDQLRNVQAQNNQQIKDQTYNLGTAVPSNLGGLIGGEGYFTSRYQVPQTVALTNDLRAAAQASALNQALQNEQAKWKQRYNKAYRSARRRAGSGGSGGGSSTDGGVNIDNGNYSVAWDRITSEIARKQYLANIEAAKQQLRDDTAEAMTVAPTPEYQNTNWQLPVPTYQGGF